MNTTKLFSFLLLISLSSCTECEEKEWDTLPPETQTGANTFGCYVNEVIFEGKTGIAAELGKAIFTDYGTQSNMLIIHANNTRKKSIQLEIPYPNEKKIHTSFKVYATLNNQHYFGSSWFIDEAGSIVDGNQDIGEIFITRFDTINKIVSGNFHCKMKNVSNGQDSIAILSQGRFDLILRINHNM